MNIGVRVGDRFEWDRNGAVVQVTAVKGRKVKFEVFGRCTMYGSMRTKEFMHKFKGKNLPTLKERIDRVFSDGKSHTISDVVGAA